MYLRSGRFTIAVGLPVYTLFRKAWFSYNENNRFGYWLNDNKMYRIR